MSARVRGVVVFLFLFPWSLFFFGLALVAKVLGR